MIVVTLPLWIDRPDITKPELHGIISGEKVSEGFALYSEIVDTMPPFAAWFAGLYNFILGKTVLAHRIVAFLILFLQCAFLAIVFIDKRAFTDNTYIPALLFGILTLISFDIFTLTPDLAAFGFSLLALNNLFKEVEFRIQRDETILNLGLYVSIATLFNPSYAVFLPGVLIILILFTRSSFRKIALLLFGFVLPHVMLMAIFYYQGRAENLWFYFYLNSFNLSSESLISLKHLMLLSSVPLFYLFVSLFILNRDARLTKYQSQLLQVMFIWMIIGAVQLFLTKDIRGQSLIVLIPPVCFFLTHFLLLIRRKKFAALNAWILLFGVLISGYLARYTKVFPPVYENLIAAKQTTDFHDQRILDLTNNHSHYLTNTIAPPFINAELTDNVFSQPDLYRNIVLIERMFKIDPPEIILDPNDKMKAYFERIPNLAQRYKKINEGYSLINN